MASFLRIADKDGLLRLKEPKGKGKGGGDAQVLSVDPNHPEVVAHRGYKTIGEVEAKVAKREEKAAAESAKPQEINVLEMYRPHGASIRIFEVLEKEYVFPLLLLYLCLKFISAKPSSSALYTSQEVKEALNIYISSNSLVNAHKRQFINLDETLASLFGGAESPEFLKREELTQQLLEVMQPWHRIEIAGAEPVTK